MDRLSGKPQAGYASAEPQQSPDRVRRSYRQGSRHPRQLSQDRANRRRCSLAAIIYDGAKATPKLRQIAPVANSTTAAITSLRWMLRLNWIRKAAMQPIPRMRIAA